MFDERLKRSDEPLKRLDERLVEFCGFLKAEKDGQ
jgi:hypothetical protein